MLLAALTDAETAERGYVITGDQSYLEPYRQSGKVVGDQASGLRELTIGSAPPDRSDRLVYESDLSQVPFPFAQR